ncbi:protein of unknown function [Bartonella clarridgeiae 73]|uniref:Uncharacterized protein n=1 Tax=Bartonella clarridgeiae (strain CCUG 45776 / CIP 104772 / 73) TaxID=696125 RepID=E6YJH3_BARC7|nr:protein of unknown function [Bartonella clarridgeiae 73]
MQQHNVIPDEKLVHFGTVYPGEKYYDLSIKSIRSSI